MPTELRTIDKVVEIPVDLIKVSNDRYRKDLGDIDELAKSIGEVGQLIPIIINEDYTLIAGERRLRATQILKKPTIEAIIRTEKTIDYRIVEAYENIFRKDFNWQEQVLAMDELHRIMRDLKGPNWSMRKTAADIGLSKSGVTTDLDLANILKEDPDVFTGCDTKKKALKALQRYKIDETMAEISLRRSKTDYGKSAQNHIFYGNCLDLIDKLPDGIVNAVISDPPFGINIEAAKRHTSDRGDISNRIYEDNTKLYKSTMISLLGKFPRVLAKDSWIAMFCGIQHFYWLYDEIVKIGFTPDIIPALWVKTGTSGQTNQPQTYFGRVYECFIYAYRGEATLVKAGQPNVFQHQVVHSIDKDHPVEKPISLLEDIINRFCITGNVILDPFCGSGSTLVAGIKRGCNPIGFELDIRYYDIAIKNVSDVLKMKDAGRLDLHGR